MIWPFSKQSREIKDAKITIEHKWDLFKGMLKDPKRADEAYLLARNIATWKRWMREKR
jgi:hypothetical protein